LSPLLPGRRNIFGGQVMAQALRAASRTVADDRLPHSLHAYFLREGLLGPDVEFTVSLTRDGRSFSVRHVIARQADRVILTLSASFHVEEPGRELATAARVVTPPTEDRPSEFPETGYGVDLRSSSGSLREGEAAARTFWARIAEPVPVADPAMNACVAAYLSDLGPGGVAATAVGLPVGLHDGGGPIMASLDHAMWFHRPARYEDWILVDAVPMSNENSRGLIRGTLHDSTGLHVASFAQELLVRER
jgi:acyl-CoA thioesterase-2